MKFYADLLNLTPAPTPPASPASRPARRPLARACRAVVEQLEKRALMAASTVQTLPFILDFNNAVGNDVLDKDGQGTGFTRVQANKNGNEYRPDLIDLDTAAGVLKLTTTGTSTAGSNTNNDNTLVNALETQFNATTSGFKITARLKGPLSYIDTPSEQAGITFGPDQDNFIKLVAISQPGGQLIQFGDETYTGGSTYGHQVNQTVSPGSFAGISALDLQLVGDATTGTVTAYYAVNGGAFVKLSRTVTLSGSIKSNFFSGAGRAGIIAASKNDAGPETMSFDSFRIDAGQPVNARPNVTAARPGNGDVGVSRDAFVSADVRLPTPGAGIDLATLNASTVKLYRTSDKRAVTLVLNTSGGGDSIIATPAALLDPNTTYTFEVTTGLKDAAGASFQPYAFSFTTGSTGGETNPSIAFEKVELPTASGQTYTAVTVGPDGKLYAATNQGLIQRFTINGDGTLGAAQNIASLIDAEGGPRLLTGIAFDPAATAGNLILWVTHSDAAGSNADEWSGKVTKLSGASLGTVRDAVINLPRAVRESSTNQLAFGPDGGLYFAQGAMTNMGALSNVSGSRTEKLLSAAILRLNTAAVGSTAIDAKTDSGGTYNPFASGAPLTIHASGVRNAYDLVWTNDGKLYAPSTGATAGGNAPGTPTTAYSFGPNQRIDYATDGPYTGPDVPALTNLTETQNDFLFNVAAGGYYGQPNPLRGEFVLNGGNPTGGIDANEITAYPVGTAADRNYRGAAFAFGKSYSPAGLIEYHGGAFGGALNNKLLVTRGGGGNDVIVLTRAGDGTISNAQSGIAGLSNFVNPVDIAQHAATGYLYVAESGGRRITLVRPVTPGANLATDKPKVVLNDVYTATGGQSTKLTITNTGTQALTLGTSAFTVTGTDAARFTLTKPTLPASLAPGQSVQVTVTFTASAVGIRTATLQIVSNDPDQPTLNVPLRGLGTAGTGGANEPSLQRVLELYQIPIDVGDSNPSDTYLNDPPATPNDEVILSQLQKAGSGPVTIEALAVFGVANTTSAGSLTNPTARVGYYTPGNRADKTELFTVSGTGNAVQTVNPSFNGDTRFDPGSGAFGLYGLFPSMYPNIYNAPGGTEAYSEDRLNAAYDPDSPRKVRFYPLKTANGDVVPNAYVFAMEDYLAGYDTQDVVGIIRNVKPAAAASAGPEIGFENTDNVPFTDRLVFNRIQVQPPDTTIDATTGAVIQPPNNVVHDVAVLKIRNSGTQSLNISGITVSSGWQIDNPPTVPFSIGAGQSVDLTVRFVATGTSGGKLVNGTLQINSNDSDEPVSTIQLAGWWQYKSEKPEPTLQQVVQLFGYGTKITNTGQNVNGGGRIERIGDEVLSPMWRRADGSKNVTVRQLVALHTQGNPAFIRYFTVNSTGTRTQTNLFTHDGTEGQSILPHVVNSLTTPAAASFSTASVFGFRVDSEWSDPSFNTIPEGSTTDEGHHIRFFVARDRDGNVIPDTFLMAMDYAGINYDYNDNLYLVTNIRPENGPGKPAGLTAAPGGAGTAMNWSDNTEANLAGYNVYRSDAADGTFTKINEILLSTSDFLDVTAPVGATAYYQVRAVDLSGNESSSASVNATRTVDTTPPGTPGNLVAAGSLSGIRLNWSNNTDLDLAGYNVYRSDSFSGAYTLLNTGGLLTSATYLDASAPQGATSYYRVTAVDTSDNESAANVANASRPSGDMNPPAAPTGASATGSLSSVFVNWNDNGETDLAGYNVYRSTAQFGTYVKLNAGLLAQSQHDDTTAPAGSTSWYRITAVDNTGNESIATTISGVRTPDTTPPAVPAGLAATGSTSGIALDWTDNTDADLGGYNLYTSSAPGGPFAKMNGSPLTASEFLDATAAQGASTYYRLTAVDSSGNESAPSDISAVRPDSVAPAAPTGLTSSSTHSGVVLNWTDNAEGDVVGYNVYRSTAADGIFALLTGSPVTASEFTDSSAPGGATSYYKVTAVDLSQNESAAAATSAFRPDLGKNGNANDMAYDKQGNLHFAYYDAVAKNVRYAVRSASSGTWSAVQTVDTTGDDVGGWLSIALDSSDKVGIAYFDGSRGDLRYATLANGAWDITTVDSKNSTGLFPSLKFDKSDRPAIAYYKKTTGDLRLAQWNGTGWAITDVATADDAGRSASLAMQPSGLWAIAYENSSRGLIQYAYQTGATTWATNTTDASTAGMSYISLAFDTSGRASVSYQETGLGDLKFAVLKNGKWAATTVHAKGAVGMYSKLVFGADGFANIFYYSKQLDSLMHARGYLGNWTIQELKQQGGRFASGALGANGKITFAWLDTASQVLALDEI
ncbi:MAG TPA: choice-of-anchor D domain-containing protein [Tepidisphaeraceae bacterium]|nr:choice-of-anchor D domain-containing protein [Tepidisphaeraceae bacterium]